MVKMGAADFVLKPFTDSDCLDKAIRRVLRQQAKPTAPDAKEGSGRFAGGELVYFEDRVELLGVKIISDRGAGHTIGILHELRARFQGQRYVPVSAEELAANLGAPDVNTIPGCIRGLRRNIVNRLRKYLDIEVGPNDVICRDEGYYLLTWITTRDAGDAGTTNVPAHVPANDPAYSARDKIFDPANVPAVPANDLNERQRWALRQLKLGVQLERAMLERKFGIAEKTAQRDLSDLSVLASSRSFDAGAWGITG